MTTALYPGSFDPVTNGHLDILARAARLFDRVVVAVGVHHAKAGLFAPDERVALLERAVSDLPGAARIRIVRFDGLVVDAARAEGAAVIVRGLRNAADFDYEDRMAGMNAALAPEVDIVYLPASGAVRFIASSLVRQIAALGGPVDAFVPSHVAERLKAVASAARRSA